jgi:hypothetical protein
VSAASRPRSRATLPADPLAVPAPCHTCRSGPGATGSSQADFVNGLLCVAPAQDGSAAADAPQRAPFRPGQPDGATTPRARTSDRPKEWPVKPGPLTSCGRSPAHGHELGKSRAARNQNGTGPFGPPLTTSGEPPLCARAAPGGVVQEPRHSKVCNRRGILEQDDEPRRKLVRRRTRRHGGGPQ